MEKQNTIKCPSYGTMINVQDILSPPGGGRIRIKYQAIRAEDQKKFAEEEARLTQAREQFEELKKRENELFQERLERQLKEERRNIEEKVKSKMQEEAADQFASLQKELNEKSEQVKELNKSKAEIEKLKREKNELKDAAEAEAQKNLNEILIAEREKIRKAEEDKNELRFREMQKQLEDQKKLTEEMKTQADQGSMQLQGEAQELAIEKWLAAQFPLDSIEEIKKARGGDCIQVVNTHTRQNCGKIYYESKRSQRFSCGSSKFQADIRIKGPDIGVLVTDAMPHGYDRMGMKDGIWICSYDEFKGLCTVSRESIIQINLAVTSQENKGDKMHLLYNFLTSNAFRLYVEAIVEGFTAMKTALDSEKRSMQRIWKEREKQIEKVITNTIDMHASIRGIAGDAVQSVKLLELPDGDVVEEGQEE